MKFVKCGSPNFLNFTPLLFQWLIYTVVTQVLRHEELLVRSVYITRIGVFFPQKEGKFTAKYNNKNLHRDPGTGKKTRQFCICAAILYFKYEKCKTSKYNHLQSHLDL